MTSPSSSIAPPSPPWPQLAQPDRIYEHGQPKHSASQEDAPRGASKARKITSTSHEPARVLNTPPGAPWPPLAQPDRIYEHGQPKSYR